MLRHKCVMTDNKAIHIDDISRRASKGRIIIAFMISVIVMALLSVVASSIFVGAYIPVNIGVSGYLDLIKNDLGGLFPILLIVINAASLIAFPCAGLTARKTGWARGFVYAVAGIVLFIVMLAAFKYVGKGVQPIGRAQFMPNYLTLLAIGAFGGWLFARLSRTKS